MLINAFFYGENSKIKKGQRTDSGSKDIIGEGIGQCCSGAKSIRDGDVSNRLSFIPDL
jgi:hypothetical protein